MASIERGRAEIDAGLGLETDDVFREVEAVIAAAKAGRPGRMSGTYEKSVPAFPP